MAACELCIEVDGTRYALYRRQYDEPLYGSPVHELVETTDESGLQLLRHRADVVECLSALRFCTFRGRHRQAMLHLLEDCNFRFIDSFLRMVVTRKQFSPLPASGSFILHKQSGLPSPETREAVLAVERQVFDYSSFQADLRLPASVGAERNCTRVRSHFEKPGHHLFLVSDPTTNTHDAIRGFIQYLDQGNTAEAVNAALSPDHQNALLGPFMYSRSAQELFIASPQLRALHFSLALSNKRVFDILVRLGFSLLDYEIHMRKVAQ